MLSSSIEGKPSAFALRASVDCPAQAVQPVRLRQTRCLRVWRVRLTMKVSIRTLRAMANWKSLPRPLMSHAGTYSATG